MIAQLWIDPLDGPPVVQVEQRIAEALDALGVDSDLVADALAGDARVRAAAGDDPVCVYLQGVLDPGGDRVLVVECDANSLSYAVLNPDGCTWTHAATALPWPVWVFCCRADAGEFPALVRASLPGGIG